MFVSEGVVVSAALLPGELRPPREPSLLVTSRHAEHVGEGGSSSAADASRRLLIRLIDNGDNALTVVIIRNLL